jgi:hypothetical protein
MSNTISIKFNSSTRNQREPLEIAASRGRTPQKEKEKEKENQSVECMCEGEFVHPQS